MRSARHPFAVFVVETDVQPGAREVVAPVPCLDYATSQVALMLVVQTGQAGAARLLRQARGAAPLAQRIVHGPGAAGLESDQGTISVLGG